MESKRRWKKILYEVQDFPDNYVDESFLDELKKNLNVRHYEFWTLVWESCVISQQLASVCMLVSVYLLMDSEMLTPLCVWLLSSGLTLSGYLCHACLLWRLGTNLVSLTQDLRTGLLFQGYSAALSPILASLTQTVSTDTVYAMTAVTMAANLLFCNYLSSQDQQLPGALSLNASIFASVCLASRLNSPLHAFATVTAAFELFALWPVLCRKVKEWSITAHVCQTFLVTVVSAGTMFVVLPVGAILYVCLVIYVTILAPLWFICLQPLKNNIHGPWDEAVLDIRKVRQMD